MPNIHYNTDYHRLCTYGTTQIYTDYYKILFLKIRENPWLLHICLSEMPNEVRDNLKAHGLSRIITDYF